MLSNFTAVIEVKSRSFGASRDFLRQIFKLFLMNKFAQTALKVFVANVAIPNRNLSK